MFSAKVFSITGSKAMADVTIEYYDDRKTPWDRVSTVFYDNVDLSTGAKQSAFVTNVVQVKLQELKTAEEDTALQQFVGMVIASI